MNEARAALLGALWGMAIRKGVIQDSADEPWTDLVERVDQVEQTYPTAGSYLRHVRPIYGRPSR